MRAINPRKQWFTSRKEAFRAWHERGGREDDLGNSFRVYRQKEGRHKGQYFVGDFIDFINRY